jgi:hypothetical protein
VGIAPIAAANLVRGQFGKILKNQYPASYAKYFAPVREGAGPSGFRDPPRPFVLRLAGLEGAIGVNLFEEFEPPLELFREVLGRVACEWFHAPRIERVEHERLEIELDGLPGSAHRLRVEFLTPTELKGCDRPEFATLFARIRDRLSMLRSLYGAGPLDIDFRGLGEKAKDVRMTRCDLRNLNVQRRSGAQGRSHSIGGFVGVAEYEGELAPFLPYFEAARWTGVGRQTVWGKGEIRSEAF